MICAWIKSKQNGRSEPRSWFIFLNKINSLKSHCIWIWKDKGDGKPKVAFDDSSFQQLEQEFQDVLQELMGDRSLEKFKVEYEKLHKALIKSHESEKRLMQKCRELNAELVANSAKVQTALKLGQEDQNTIASLRKVKLKTNNVKRNFFFKLGFV